MRERSRLHPIRVVLVSFLALGVIAGTAVAAGVEPVIDTNADEWQASASDGYLLWSRNTARRPRHYDAFAKPDGEPKFRLNPGGTFGWGTGVDGTTGVYQQATRVRSDIKMYDLVMRERSSPPRGLNTDVWEYGPDISGDFILFQRNNIGYVSNPDREWQRVILFNTDNRRSRVLAYESGRSPWLAPGQVNGDFAVWDRCSGNGCNAYRHEISAKDSMRIPNPSDKWQYAPAVGPDGATYFVRSGKGCGKNVAIVRWTEGGPDRGEVILSLRDGRDASELFILENMDGSDTLYFSRTVCKTGYGDIYMLDGADTASPVARLVSSRASVSAPSVEWRPGPEAMRGPAA
jgi:hypothetical protein